MILWKVTQSVFLEFLKFYLKIFFLILLEIDYRGYQIGAVEVEETTECFIMVNKM